MHTRLPATFDPAADAAPYVALPSSSHRVKFAFRVDFTNGGHMQGEDFLLDIEGNEVTPQRLAEMIVSAMNLLRSGPVTIRSMQVCIAVNMRMLLESPDLSPASLVVTIAS